MSLSGKKVMIRADASAQIGMGHVQRCMTLAVELIDRGAEVHFFGYCPNSFRTSVADIPGLNWNWLEEPTLEPESFRQLLFQTARRDFDLVVVDHYKLAASWELEAVGTGAYVLAIDDCADRPHAAQVLLDQNLFDQPEQRYAALTPPDSDLLLGPKFALLRREFAVRRKVTKFRTGLSRILVQAGGSDPTGLTEATLKALAPLMTGKLRVRVIAGSANMRSEQIRHICLALPGCEFLESTNSMAEQILWADLCIGASGSSVWERACLGCPSLVVSVAANQHPIARAADSAGILQWLGPQGDTTVQLISDAVSRYSSDPGLLERVSARAFSFVDGLGTQRVCDTLETVLI